MKETIAEYPTIRYDSIEHLERQRTEAKERKDHLTGVLAEIEGELSDKFRIEGMSATEYLDWRHKLLRSKRRLLEDIRYINRWIKVANIEHTRWYDEERREQAESLGEAKLVYMLVAQIVQLHKQYDLPYNEAEQEIINTAKTYVNDHRG